MADLDDVPGIPWLHVIAVAIVAAILHATYQDKMETKLNTAGGAVTSAGAKAPSLGGLSSVFGFVSRLKRRAFKKKSPTSAPSSAASDTSASDASDTSAGDTASNSGDSAKTDVARGSKKRRRRKRMLLFLFVIVVGSLIGVGLFMSLRK